MNSGASSPEACLNLADRVASLLAEAGAAEVIKGLYDLDRRDRQSVRRLWSQLSRAGLTALTVPENYGGSAASEVDLMRIFEDIGRATLPGPFLTSTMLAVPMINAFGDESVKHTVLPRVASAEHLITASLNRFDKARCEVRWAEEGSLSGQVGMVLDADICDQLLLFARSDTSSDNLVLIDLKAPGVELREMASADHTRAIFNVRLDRVANSYWRHVTVPGSPLDEAEIAKIENVAYAALCLELVGVSRQALDISVAYASRRKQFDQAIGSFQSVKHRCVEMLMRCENAYALAHRAFLMRAAKQPEAVAAAKAYCSDAAKACAGDAIQVHGGVGFTWDHETNRLYRRALSGEALMGSALQHRPVVSAALMAAAENEENPDELADLPLSDADKLFRSRLVQWLRENPAQYDPAAFPTLSSDERFAVQREWQRKLHAAGWVGLEFPIESGGQGASLVQQAIYNFELNRFDNSGLANDVAIAVAAPAIVHWGSDFQKRRYVPPMLNADEIWCQGYSEPDAGSDLASLKMMAVDDGDHYIVTGSKIWTTIAHLADYCILLVRTDPGSVRHHGLSCLILDMRASGVTIRPLMQLNGDPEFAELVLDGVRVPKENRIGDEGQGWKVALTSLSYERAGRSNAYKLDQTLRKLVNEVRESADDFTDTQRAIVNDGIARLAIEVLALRHCELLMLADRLNGTAPGERSSIAKLASSELIQRMAHFAMEVLDGAILGRGTAHAAWLKLALTSRYYTIASGTSEVQRNVLGERVLGLPKA